MPCILELQKLYDYLENKTGSRNDYIKNTLSVLRASKDRVLNQCLSNNIHILVAYPDDNKALAILKEAIDSYKAGQQGVPFNTIDKPYLISGKSTPIQNPVIQHIPDDTCIIYTFFTDLDYFKNTFKATEKSFKVPLFYLRYKNIYTDKIPEIDLNTIPFKKAILWQDNYYPTSVPQYEYTPLVVDNHCTGPIVIDIEKFRANLNNILAYDDIKYGYLKETNSFTKDEPSVYVMDHKVCCREKRNYYSHSVVAVEEGGRPYLELLPSLYLKINKGE